MPAVLCRKKNPSTQTLAYLINSLVSLLNNGPFSVASYCSYQNPNKTSNEPVELGEFLTIKAI